MRGGAFDGVGQLVPSFAEALHDGSAAALDSLRDDLADIGHFRGDLAAAFRQTDDETVAARVEQFMQIPRALGQRILQIGAASVECAFDFSKPVRQGYADFVDARAKRVADLAGASGKRRNRDLLSPARPDP